jgi:membrane protease YdiL (CAAX protease family)
MIALWRRASWRDLGLDRHKPGRDVALGTLGFLVVAFPVYLMHVLLIRWSPSDPHPIETLLRERGDLTAFFWCGLSVVVIAPVTEELMFRLVLQGSLEAWDDRLFGAATAGGGQGHDTPGRAAPILASSLLFAALHPWPSMLPLFVLSLALGFLYHQTHRIVPCIILHMLLNACSLAALALSLSSDQAPVPI